MDKYTQLDESDEPTDQSPSAPPLSSPIPEPRVPEVEVGMGRDVVFEIESLSPTNGPERSRISMLPLPLPRQHPGGALSEFVSEREHGEYIDAVNMETDKEFEGLGTMQTTFRNGMIVLIGGWVFLSIGMLRLFIPYDYYLLTVFMLLLTGLLVFFGLIYWRKSSISKAAKWVLEMGNELGNAMFSSRGVHYKLELIDKSQKRWKLTILVRASANTPPPPVVTSQEEFNDF
eukprot:CAMPEP_0201518020 /NCGR_PEP_ID=MMETSP0161_2-20130828/8966_1 /ASSEMBLY_ACC=CAM_ASM_000251 /TAXON_ID=180227 /ORGANISM="Neoparamoeba aestuarina, Strain SoJaBio B1-5/56/2" /LENGTH=230 /DNA_ID=CAMNT_0047915667 /DNA_START=87 /DNA_END=779 /DNA_ORIENTATION=-